MVILEAVWGGGDTDGVGLPPAGGVPPTEVPPVGVPGPDDTDPGADDIVEGPPPPIGVDIPSFMAFSISAFSSSVIMVVAVAVMSFIMEISPIYATMRQYKG
jgi:hypothetical protein